MKNDIDNRNKFICVIGKLEIQSPTNHNKNTNNVYKQEIIYEETSDGSNSPFKLTRLLNLTTPEPSIEDYKKFLKEGLTDYDEDGETNVAHNFDLMLTLFGQCYIYWLESQYRMVEFNGSKLEEVAKINGDVPLEFFEQFKENYTQAE